MQKGYFITLEGPDGAGKTTQLARLYAAASAAGLTVVSTREPGGTPVGDAIRGILLDPHYGEIIPLTEALLYAASRAQLVKEVIKPALAAGKLVLCDRFIDSSLAYQSFGGGLDFDFVWRTNLAAVDGCLPDKTFILNINPQVGLARRGAAAADRMEQKSLAFHQRVQQGFLQLAQQFPERLTVIEAERTAPEVFKEIWQQVAAAVTSLRGNV
ncbi:MAG TPA: dTMP kinase [Oscillospiraceae bacterium]|nr:dTMP kinase [Oscillospiraceae bacterium]